MHGSGTIGQPVELEASLAEAIAKQRDRLISEMRERIRSRVGALPASETLSFFLISGNGNRSKVSPEASLRYVGVLTKFMSGENYEGRQIESAVTPVAVKAVEQSIIDFYTGQQVADAVSERLSSHLAIAVAARRVVTGQVAAEGRSVMGTALGQMTKGVQRRLEHEAIDNISSFFHSAFGHQLMVVVGQTMATTGGKVVMMNVIKVAVANAMASSAFHALIMNLIRKFGVGIIIKTAVGKAIVILMAAVGIAHVPLLWILIPVIAAFLMYEYSQFPEKIADRLSNDVPNEIARKFDEMNREIVHGMIPGMMEEMRSGLRV